MEMSYEEIVAGIKSVLENCVYTPTEEIALIEAIKIVNERKRGN